MVCGCCLPRGASTGNVGQATSSVTDGKGTEGGEHHMEEHEYPIEPTEAEKWIVCPRRKPEATYRMICLPWAGGNSSIYSQWALPDTEVMAIELPGRQGRLSEAPLRDFHSIVARIAQVLDVLGYLRSSGKPLLIFGHSFGSMLAYHVCRRLREAPYSFTPHYLIVSGGQPLDERQSTGVSLLKDEQLIKYLVDMGGLPVAVASNRELMDLFLPAIKADYYAIDKYTYNPGPPLSCPVLALSGVSDAKAGPSDMAGWRRLVSPDMPFELVPFQGGHFFLKEHKDKVLEAIRTRALALALQPPGAGASGSAVENAL